MENLWQRAADASAVMHADGSGARATVMNEIHERLDADQRDLLRVTAEVKLRHWETNGGYHSRESESAFATAAAVNTANSHLIPNVFDGERCVSIVDEVKLAVTARGGWDRERHSGDYRTMDIPLSAVPAHEEYIRQRVFERILCPNAARFFGPGTLPEHLCFRDVFIVFYSCITRVLRLYCVYCSCLANCSYECFVCVCVL